MSGRFEILLDRFQNGDAAPAELEELEALLRDRPDRRRILVERLLQEVQLFKAFAGLAPLQPVPVALPAAPVRMGWFVPVASAAAVLLLALSAWLVFYPYFFRSSLGAVVESGQVRAGNTTVARIPLDVPFLVEGDAAAVVRLPDGARADLEPSSRAIIHSQAADARLVVELRQGAGKFSVPPGPGQFRVETPLGSVAVLGTEFTVTLSARKNAAGRDTPTLAVAVASGTVRVQIGANAHVLAAGSSRLFPAPDVLIADNAKPPNDADKNDKKPQHIDGVQEKPGPHEQIPDAVEGVLKRVDVRKQSIIVTTTKKGGETDQRFDLVKDAAVVIGEVAGTLGDLKTGMDVHLTLSADRKAVVEIQQEAVAAKLPEDKAVAKGNNNDKDDKNKADWPGKGSRDVHGTVKALDAVKGTITLTRKEKGKVGERTYSLMAAVPVYLGVAQGALSDVPRGAEVHLRLSQSRQTVIEIRIEQKKGKS